MADYQHRNQSFDYAPPPRSGSAGGALLLVIGVIAFFVLGLFMLGSGGETTAPAPEPSAPVAAPAAGE